MKRMILLVTVLAAMRLPASAAVIGKTSFENEFGSSGASYKYYDTNPAGYLVDHDLLNVLNPNGTPKYLLVDSTAASVTAGDLTFNATWKNTKNSNGLYSTGAFCGITTYTNASYGPASYTDGTKGYEIMTTAGKWVLTFQPVSLTGQLDVACLMDLHISNATYGAGDKITAIVYLDGVQDPNTAITLFSAEGTGIEAYDTRSWGAYTGAIPNGHTSAQLVITVETDAAYEGIYIDNIRFISDYITQTLTYNWQDGYGTLLNYYGNITDVQNDANGVNRVLSVSEYPIVAGHTPKINLAYIRNMVDGDIVTVKFKVYDTSAGVNPSYRIGADFAYSDNIESYQGSAGYNSLYSAGTGWEEISYTVTFDNWESYGRDADALMFHCRLYSDETISNPQTFLIDDLTVTAPAHVQVVIPPLYNPANYKTLSYGWENFSPSDRPVVLLDTFGAINASLETSMVNSGTKSLKISVAKDGVTPEGFVAWIKGLNNNDKVLMNAMAKQLAGQTANSGVRIWAHYTYDNNNSQSYAGSAYGSDTYSGSDWTTLSHTWLFDNAPYNDNGTQRIPTGLMIEARVYSALNQGGFMDDIELTIPNSATVVFPSPTGKAICVGGLPTYDFNGDCKVTLADFTVFAQTWMQCNRQPAADCGL